MARIPRSFARRARSMASSFLGTPSGSACACISIAPLRVCAFADSEKTRNIAASCDLMDRPFIEQVSLELGLDLIRHPSGLRSLRCACDIVHGNKKACSSSEFSSHPTEGERSCQGLF